MISPMSLSAGPASLTLSVPSPSGSRAWPIDDCFQNSDLPVGYWRPDYGITTNGISTDMVIPAHRLRSLEGRGVSRLETGAAKDGELTESKPGRLAVGGWISFEVANVVFWMGIVGMVFPLWAGDDVTVGYTLAATMAVVLLASPIIGALSDQSGRRKPYLMGAAAICVAATMFVGEGSLISSLALFALAFTSMELATILYKLPPGGSEQPEQPGRHSRLGRRSGLLGGLHRGGMRPYLF